MFKGQAGKKYIKYISLGFEIAVGLSAPIVIGFWIDSSFNTMPWFTLAGVLLGVVILMGILIRTARSLDSESE